MKLLAQVQTNPFGTVPVPDALKNFAGGNVQGGAIGAFLDLILRTIIVAGGVYALFNLVLAGYAFMSAGDDPKKMEGAWGKIWQTGLGLLFMAGAFVLAAIFSQLIFGRWDFILNPQIPTI